MLTKTSDNNNTMTIIIMEFIQNLMEADDSFSSRLYVLSQSSYQFNSGFNIVRQSNYYLNKYNSIFYSVAV